MAGWNEDIKKELGYCGNNVVIGNYTILTNPKNVFLGDNVRIDPFCLITTALEVELRSDMFTCCFRWRCST